jgi:hypothetical protein
MPPPPEIKEPAQIPARAQKTPPPRPAPKKKDASPPAPPRPLRRRSSRRCSHRRRRNWARSFRTNSAASTKPTTHRVSRVPGRRCSRRRANRSVQTQRETVERIQTFIQQAEESKGRDLATALQLVRRADVLGQDLLKTSSKWQARRFRRFRWSGGPATLRSTTPAPPPLQTRYWTALVLRESVTFGVARYPVTLSFCTSLTTNS